MNKTKITINENHSNVGGNINAGNTLKKSPISRRRFLQGVLGVGSLLLSGGAGLFFTRRSDLDTSFSTDYSNTSYKPLEVEQLRQIVALNSDHSRTLMWEMKRPLPNVEVIDLEIRPLMLKGKEIKEIKDRQAKLFTAKEDFFTDGGETVYQYTVTVEDLVENSRYEYRLITPTLATPWLRLTTASRENAFKAIIFPDSQSGDYSDWQSVAGAAWEKESDATLFINMGDLVDNGESRSQWRAWFQGIAEMQKEISFAPVMGNHEAYNLEWKTRLPNAYLRYFAVPDNGSEIFPRYYYSFDFGAVHFVVLNTQDNEFGEYKKGIDKEQLAWLERDLEYNKMPWTVALMHRDVLQYRIHGRPERLEGFSEEGVRWMPVFDSLGVDLVLSAHLHTYRNRGRIYNFERSYDRGPLYILTGVAGDVRYPNLWIDHALDLVTLPQPETNNYLTLEAGQNRLTVQCYLPNGTPMDSVDLEK